MEKLFKDSPIGLYEISSMNLIVIFGVLLPELSDALMTHFLYGFLYEMIKGMPAATF